MNAKEFKVGQIWKMRSESAGHARILSIRGTGLYPVIAEELDTHAQNSHASDGSYSVGAGETSFDLTELVSESESASTQGASIPDQARYIVLDRIRSLEFDALDNRTAAESYLERAQASTDAALYFRTLLGLTATQPLPDEVPF